MFRSVLCAFLVVTMGVSCSLAAGGGDDEIRIGSSLPLGGPMGYLGLAVSHGFESYLRSVNEAGGVAGKKVRLVVYNDGYDPDTCDRNTRKLIEEDRVLALTCYVGTASPLRAQGAWTEARVPAVGFMSGAEVLRVPFNRYTIHVRASCFQETAAIVDALVDKRDIRRVAVVYRNDASGDAVRWGAERALRRRGLRPAGFFPFDADAKDFDDVIARVKAVRPEAVIMAGTYLQLDRFIKRARKSGLRKTIFCSVSTLGTEAFARKIGGAGKRCLISQVVPPYKQSSLPVVGRYRAALKKYFPSDLPSSAGLEGFITARVIVQGIRRCGEDVSRERLIDAIESMPSCDTETGLYFEYGPENHQGLSDIYLTHIRGGTCGEISDWNVFRK